jgi:hypothetical protein
MKFLKINISAENVILIISIGSADPIENPKSINLSARRLKSRAQMGNRSEDGSKLYSSLPSPEEISLSPPDK